MSRTMRLPRLVAGREFAPKMVEAALGEVTGEDVVVDCAELLSGSASFAAGLVEAILIDGKAASLTLLNSPERFASYVTDAVRDWEVADRSDLAVQHQAAG